MVNKIWRVICTGHDIDKRHNLFVKFPHNQGSNVMYVTDPPLSENFM